MDRKQKEALVLALAEKGKTYREITKEAGVSPNTIKAVLNKAGLDETASISSRAFELYVQQKTPVEVAIALNLKAKETIDYYHGTLCFQIVLNLQIVFTFPSTFHLPPFR